MNDLLGKPLQDEVVVFQTDTVYGIGCLLSSSRGVETIYNIKKRDGKKPLAVLCASIEQVALLVDDMDDVMELGKQHWPGALTLVVPKSERIPDYVTSGMSTVGVRIPNDPIALAILSTFGPMAVTSLNVSNEPAITSYDDAKKFDEFVDYTVIGTDTQGRSSTVYDVHNQRILRQGDVIIG